MKIPYFRARDLNSDQMVEGFYVNFPETEAKDAPLVHALMVTVPVERPDLNIVFDPGNGKKVLEPEPPKMNTLMYCTIDITTLEKIGEIETIGGIYLK